MFLTVSVKPRSRQNVWLQLLFRIRFDCASVPNKVSGERVIPSPPVCESRRAPDNMLRGLTRITGGFITQRLQIHLLRAILSYDEGRCSLMISLDCGGILSGKRTENSTMRSPHCEGFLGKGRPSPRSRFTVPGLMMSWQGREMSRFSSVGMLTVQPHNACGAKNRRRWILLKGMKF